ncbi:MULTISPECIES: hypothetical protein [Rhizobium]|uniref:Uncharacterized protein n=5 Tax=Rhizobium TaxID=379 RepID=A0A6P1CCP4_RHITR|nr:MULTISPECIES: hypothetical protein [Rhizobium]AGB73708.1 hypothetical protein RTCIAT899_PB02315 [Rhizobium tropici CIAT 899]ENN87170.1 hypothetical protein RHSP_79788 [Rhizobium freirei PRF 81]MBB4245239.1 hypothetical protein [Rhizobium tropici]MBB4570005.1 hypothetical protein [Rhizobium leucaenae]MBB5576311.1 hypothetical protein [Rhizobium paranaense]
MLAGILRYCFDIAKKNQALRPFVAIYRLLRRLFHRILDKYPSLAIIAIVAIIIFMTLNPEYAPDLVKPSHGCELIQIGNGELYTVKGDTLHFSGDRPCQSRQPVAFDWFNRFPTKMIGLGSQPDAVSAGIFFNELATEATGANEWHEYTLFHQANDFTWTMAPGASMVRETFLKGGCGYDTSNPPPSKELEARDGLLLTAEQLRSSVKLPENVWEKCNTGSPEDETWDYCHYTGLEFFIPTVSPHNVCAQHSWRDAWIPGGTRKILLGKPEAYEKLSRLSQDRWDVGKIKEVSADDWAQMTADLPKVCMRWKDKGKPNWEEFASLAAIWCDY